MEGRIDPNYSRVAPRDLFNEAMLLKCLGKLTLLILDEGIHEKLSYSYTGKPFQTAHHQAGYLIIYKGVTIKKGRKSLMLGTQVNTRSAWPLCVLTDENEDIPVFDDAGNLDEEFLEFLDRK